MGVVTGFAEDDLRLDIPVGDGMRPRSGVVSHVTLEIAFHSAEVGTMRHLYRATPATHSRSPRDGRTRRLGSVGASGSPRSGGAVPVERPNNPPGAGLKGRPDGRVPDAHNATETAPRTQRNLSPNVGRRATRVTRVARSRPGRVRRRGWNRRGGC